MLTDGCRVTNGCGDEKIRLVVNVVNGRLVVVENACVVYVEGFIVVDVVDLSEGCEVVETIGIGGDFVVNFGVYVDVVVVPVESQGKKRFEHLFEYSLMMNHHIIQTFSVSAWSWFSR